jgi:hypothetical protein
MHAQQQTAFVLRIDSSPALMPRAHLVAARLRVRAPSNPRRQEYISEETPNVVGAVRSGVP